MRMRYLYPRHWCARLFDGLQLQRQAAQRRGAAETGRLLPEDSPCRDPGRLLCHLRLYAVLQKIIAKQKQMHPLRYICFLHILFWAIPHNSKCRYGERGAADAKPKAQIILESYRAFWQRRCRAAAAGAVLKPQGGNCAVLP